jgi:hypothetical protein
MQYEHLNVYVFVMITLHYLHWEHIWMNSRLFYLIKIFKLIYDHAVEYILNA